MYFVFIQNLQNLEYNWTHKEFGQFLTKLSIPFEKASKAFKATSGTITFKSIEDKEKSKPILLNEMINGKHVIVKEQEEVNKRKLMQVVENKHAEKRRRY